MATQAGGGRRWAVVLAGGEGERMRPFIRFWLGREVPKQYCRFTGKTSMFGHTLRRASHLVGRGRIAAVVGSGHRRWTGEDEALVSPGLLIEQPAKRGTAAGLLVAAAEVLARDPEATLLVLPSDHFIHPTGAFLERASRALGLAEAADGRLVLLAAAADRPETDYGWVEPGAALPGPAGAWAYAAAAFEEKPAPERARQFLARGMLWNTMIVAVKGRALWSLAWEHLPELMPAFERLRHLAATPHGRRRLAWARRLAYARLPEADLSRRLLAPSVGRALVVPLDGVLWNDWGRPERVAETLAAIGARPSFPLEAPRQALSVPA